MLNNTVLKNLTMVNAQYNRCHHAKKNIYWLRKDDVYFLKGWKMEEDLITEEDLILQLYDALCKDNFWEVYGYDDKREYNIKKQIGFDGITIKAKRGLFDGKESA